MSIAFRLLFLRKTAKTEKKIANEKSELEKKNVPTQIETFAKDAKQSDYFNMTSSQQLSRL
jgi:hypothetical protein